MKNEHFFCGLCHLPVLFSASNRDRGTGSLTLHCEQTNLSL